MDVIEAGQIIRLIAALLFVIALMGGMTIVMKVVRERQGIGIGARRRLRIIEVLPIDSKRKAVLLKRDNKEHLVILGANSEVLIESGIESAQDGEVISLKTDEKKNVS